MTTINILNAKELWTYNCLNSRDRLVVRTLRCGRSNPGSNPGHGRAYSVMAEVYLFLILLYVMSKEYVLVFNKNTGIKSVQPDFECCILCT